MFLQAGDEDTICALSTPPGHGGIAVVRLSGPSSLRISRKLCHFLPDSPESHRVYYGLCAASSEEAIDEVLVSFFATGRSFTGEETIEISCHGSPLISSIILRELIAAGARLARPGEFTYRAFMNGRLDLVQAESVLALIESQSAAAARVALRQLQGHLSTQFAEIEDDLIWILAHLEASIDFSTEGIEVVPSQHLTDRTKRVVARVEELLASYAKGKLLREGVEIAIVGRANAGKSSLLNAFLREDRAIVTAHEGTTRDTIEGQISIAGVPVTLVDTAGLRSTENEVERLGIERSKAAMKRADYIFQVLDILDPVDGLAEIELSVNSFYLLNKAELGMGDHKALAQVLIERGANPERIFAVSAKSRMGLDEIESALTSLVQTEQMDQMGLSRTVTQARHFELLQKIHSCLLAAIDLIKWDTSPEFIAFELQQAVRAIHELLGKEFNEQVIDRVFKEFCLGK